MPKWFLPLVVLMAVGLIGSIGLLLVIGLPQRAAERRGEFVGDPLTPDPGLEVLRFPDFDLVNQRGEAVDQSLLEGGIAIVDFTFTYCPFACPGMNAEMMRMQSMLDGLPIAFVSMSVDPERDTPERLAEHARDLNAEPRWTFLTGDAGEVATILTQHLMFDLQEDEANPIRLPGGGEMANIVHPTRFFLVGPQREVLALASYTSPEEVDRFAARARAAVEALSER